MELGRGREKRGRGARKGKEEASVHLQPQGMISPNQKRNLAMLFYPGGKPVKFRCLSYQFPSFLKYKIFRCHSKTTRIFFSITLIPANLKLAFSVLPFYLGGTLAGFLPADNKTLPCVHSGSVLPVQVGGLIQRWSWGMGMFQRAIRLPPGTCWFSWNL